MRSDPDIRKQVVEAAPEDEWLKAETMHELRAGLHLEHVPLGKLRRAISSLHYGHPEQGVRLHRPFRREGQSPAWAVRRFPRATG